jgi:hypothetical protein
MENPLWCGDEFVVANDSPYYRAVLYGCKNHLKLPIRTHELSLRRGAELLQMPYRAFLELMADHRVPSIDYDAGWLDKEHLFEEGSKQTPA